MRVPLFTLFGMAILTAGAAQAEDGAALFSQNCALCHQVGATGLPGQFPRLAGRVGPISKKPEGRAYLIHVLSYGMTGQIIVDKQPILGAMPPFQLTDEQLSALFGYLQSLGGGAVTPITVEEIAAERAKPRKTSADVMMERKALVSAKVIN